MIQVAIIRHAMQQVQDLFIFGLINDICSSDYSVSNESMTEINKLGRMWKDEAGTSLKYCPIQAHARRD
jgi:hypothetical protein